MIYFNLGGRGCNIFQLGWGEGGIKSSNLLYLLHLFLGIHMNECKIVSMIILVF